MQSENSMLVVVSPRKSGTHLVTNWISPNFPYMGQLKIGSHKAGHYSLGKTFHTSFRNFFFKLDREDFSGGKLLPLNGSLGLVTCRHPADTFLSHIEYSFKLGNTSFSNINLPTLKDIVEFTFANNLYEDFFEAHFEYTAWSLMNNFLTVGFEDLQLGLSSGQSSGYNSAFDVSERLLLPIHDGFLKDSPTLNVGVSGRGVQWINENEPDIFNNEAYLKYCDFYGYEPKQASRPSKLKFLNTELQINDDRPIGTPILIDEDFLGHRIIYFDKWVYAVSHTEDFFELMEAGKLKFRAQSLEEAKVLIGAQVNNTISNDQMVVAPNFVGSKYDQNIIQMDGSKQSADASNNQDRSSRLGALFVKSEHSESPIHNRVVDVIGFPRTGFSLLISIIAEINASIGLAPSAKINNEKNDSEFEQKLSDRLRQRLEPLGVFENLIFNKNFLPPLGGPNWIDPEKGTLCIRKYIGFKDHGDMTIICSVPLSFVNMQAIPHSHGPLNSWLQRRPESNLFHSIRGPAGTINSAVHSINALTSEYFQRWLPHLTDTEEENIRQRLAISKLSDISFFEAMAAPMLRSYQTLVEHLDKVHLHKWEDIVGRPVETIKLISKQLNVDIEAKTAYAIWRKISYRNLTQSHQHNFRKKGVDLSGHNSTLTNKHIEILRDFGFCEIARELNIEEPTWIDPSSYSNFQYELDAAISQNKKIEFPDEELFWLSFQKSNIDFSNFNFRLFDWKTSTKLERTNIESDELIHTVWEVFEDLFKEYTEQTCIDYNLHTN